MDRHSLSASSMEIASTPGHSMDRSPLASAPCSRQERRTDSRCWPRCRNLRPSRVAGDFKPVIDDRYLGDEIVSPATRACNPDPVSKREGVRLKIDGAPGDGVDESHFFGPDWWRSPCNYPSTRQAGDHRRLDKDYLGALVRAMPELLCQSESITKMRAICMRCGNPAKHTQRGCVESNDLLSSSRRALRGVAAGAVSSRACRSRKCLIRAAARHQS